MASSTSSLGTPSAVAGTTYTVSVSPVDTGGNPETGLPTTVGRSTWNASGGTLTSVAAGTAGTYTLTFTAPTTATTGTPNPVTVNYGTTELGTFSETVTAATANKVVVTSTAPGWNSSINTFTTSSTNDNATFTIAVEDKYGNTVTTNNDTIKVTLTAGSPADGGDLNGILTDFIDSPQTAQVTLSGGTGSFTYYGVNGTPGTGTISFADSTTSSLTSQFPIITVAQG